MSLPAPDPRKVVIRVEKCDVCETGFHIFGRETAVRALVVPGYDYCRQVAEVGDMVNLVHVGD